MIKKIHYKAMSSASVHFNEFVLFSLSTVVEISLTAASSATISAYSGSISSRGLIPGLESRPGLSIAARSPFSPIRLIYLL